MSQDLQNRQIWSTEIRKKEQGGQLLQRHRGWMLKFGLWGGMRGVLWLELRGHRWMQLMKKELKPGHGVVHSPATRKLMTNEGYSTVHQREARTTLSSKAVLGADGSSGHMTSHFSLCAFVKQGANNGARALCRYKGGWHRQGPAYNRCSVRIRFPFCPHS